MIMIYLLFLFSLVSSMSHLTDILGHIKTNKEESEMSMLEIVKHHGYPIEHQYVETEDGYFLDVYRVRGPRGTGEEVGER